MTGQTTFPKEEQLPKIVLQQMGFVEKYMPHSGTQKGSCDHIKHLKIHRLVISVFESVGANYNKTTQNKPHYKKQTIPPYGEEFVLNNIDFRLPQKTPQSETLPS